MHNPFSLEGKIVLITGASSGIGKTTAIECSKLGARCIITARNEDRLQDVFNHLSGSGHSVVSADLNNDEHVDLLVNIVPSLDGVVFNAGIATSKPLQFYKKNNVISLFETNVFSSMMLTKLLLKKKKINNEASLVFTSSIAALSSDFGNGIYGSSKAALLSYMKYCARELASRQIRANAVLPGVIETKLIHDGAISEEEFEIEKQRYPLQRYGVPEDVAYAIIYFLSNASSWVTGSSLIVDGGIMLV